MLIALAKISCKSLEHFSRYRGNREKAWGRAGGRGHIAHATQAVLVIITEGKQEMKTEILMNYLEKQMQRERDAGHGAYKIRHLIVSLSVSFFLSLLAMARRNSDWALPPTMRSRRCLQLCPCPCPSPGLLNLAGS